MNGRVGYGKWSVVADAAAVTALLGLSYYFSSELRAEDPSDAFRIAQEAGESNGGEPVAVVNGTVLDRSLVASMQAMASAFPAPDRVQPGREEDVVEWLIDRELLRQEAERRGLRPADSAVEEAVAQQQKALIEARASGDVDSALSNAIEGWEKIGHPIESWETDEYVLRVYHNLIQQTLLIQDETKDIDVRDPRREEKVDQRMKDLVAELRKIARIQYR
jgi:hypothetical protein